MKNTLLKEIVSRIVARQNCLKSGNDEWYKTHGEALRALISRLPSGSGLDRGTRLDEEKSGEYRLVLLASYHHMNEDGMYDGWTEHTITVKPNLLHGFELSISGRDRNDIKDYLNEVYILALREEVTP